MYNVVNGRTLRLDQHSAALINEGEPIFKIPTFSLDGGVVWRGCYGTPSTALAALKAYSDKKKLAEEKHKELVDIFTASIFRTDTDKPETKDIHVTVTAAPPASMLKLFGGPLSMEDFCKRFDEKGIMKQVFNQKLPESEQKEPIDGESLDQSKGQSTDWYSYVVPHDGKCNNDFVAQLPNIRVQVPRNMTNVLRWLQEVYQATKSSTTSGNLDTFCILLHHERKNIVAIADPFEWHEGKFNVLASNMMNRQQVFGDATFLSKSAPIYSKKKKQKKDKKPVASTSASDEVKPEKEKEKKEEDMIPVISADEIPEEPESIKLKNPNKKTNKRENKPKKDASKKVKEPAAKKPKKN